MSEFYTLKIAGLERKLEKFPVSDKLDIAAFIIFGDVELTIAGCAELLKKVPEFDVILTPEASRSVIKTMMPWNTDIMMTQPRTIGTSLEEIPLNI